MRALVKEQKLDCQPGSHSASPQSQVLTRLAYGRRPVYVHVRHNTRKMRFVKAKLPLSEQFSISVLCWQFAASLFSKRRKLLLATHSSAIGKYPRGVIRYPSVGAYRKLALAVRS